MLETLKRLTAASAQSDRQGPKEDVIHPWRLPTNPFSRRSQARRPVHGVLGPHKPLGGYRGLPKSRVRAFRCRAFPRPLPSSHHFSPSCPRPPLSQAFLRTPCGNLTFDSFPSGSSWSSARTARASSMRLLSSMRLTAHVGKPLSTRRGKGTSPPHRSPCLVRRRRMRRTISPAARQKAVRKERKQHRILTWMSRIKEDRGGVRQRIPKRGGARRSFRERRGKERAVSKNGGAGRNKT